MQRMSRDPLFQSMEADSLLDPQIPGFSLKKKANDELVKINYWLRANKLSLN